MDACERSYVYDHCPVINDLFYDSTTKATKRKIVMLHNRNTTLLDHLQRSALNYH
jgi:hypothetical protein